MTTTTTTTTPKCKYLVLDAGPLLSLAPLRGLAENFLTVPQVLSELKDPKARQHFEQLGLSLGVNIDIKEPDTRCLSEVIQFAKKTGDYAVLSHADLCVIALALSLQRREKGADVVKEQGVSVGETESGDAVEQKSEGQTEAYNPGLVPEEGAQEEIEVVEIEGDSDDDVHDEVEVGGQAPEGLDNAEGDEAQIEREPLDVSLVPLNSSSEDPSTSNVEESSPNKVDDAPLFEDPSDEDDGEGDWVTPSNIDLYKSQALELVPSEDISDPFTTVSRKSKGRRRHAPKDQDSSTKVPENIVVGCMTADFAMQNVIMQMGLNLVGMEGKRIQKVKNWVLRCHACFKICKDNAKKFCPSCGNPTLLRTSVTISAPGADGSPPKMQVHLKKNFVYRTRGTVYSIPSPKSGTSKTGSGEGIILREDQLAYMRAMKREEGRREREEKKMLNGAVAAAKSGKGVQIGAWMDPDWTPGILAGVMDKGRNDLNNRVPVGADGMPIIGYGKKNPNARRRKK